VQLTPPGSACSIQLGTSLTDTPAGTDLGATRTGLLARGVQVRRPPDIRSVCL
jgi:hypothetical protein